MSLPAHSDAGRRKSTGRRGYNADRRAQGTRAAGSTDRLVFGRRGGECWRMTTGSTCWRSPRCLGPDNSARGRPPAGAEALVSGGTTPLLTASPDSSLPNAVRNRLRIVVRDTCGVVFPPIPHSVGQPL